MRCKVGDLAVTTIKTPLCGCFCTVVKIAEVGDCCAWGRVIPNDHLGPIWWVVFYSLPPGFEDQAGKEVLFYDQFLDPIRPGSLDEETTESRELEAA